jgi:hypothetical protein
MSHLLIGFFARLLVFVRYMQEAFEDPKNGAKPDWNQEPREYVILHADQAFRELLTASLEMKPNPAAIRHHAANAANWAFILADYYSNRKRRDTPPVTVPEVTAEPGDTAPAETLEAR